MVSKNSFDSWFFQVKAFKVVEELQGLKEVLKLMPTANDEMVEVLKFICNLGSAVDMEEYELIHIIDCE